MCEGGVGRCGITSTSVTDNYTLWIILTHLQLRNGVPGLVVETIVDDGNLWVPVTHRTRARS